MERRVENLTGKRGILKSITHKKLETGNGKHDPAERKKAPPGRHSAGRSSGKRAFPRRTDRFCTADDIGCPSQIRTESFLRIFERDAFRL
jgi:hypothetical protein